MSTEYGDIDVGLVASPFILGHNGSMVVEMVQEASDTVKRIKRGYRRVNLYFSEPT